MKLTTIILTKNEETNIERSIKSCLFADEVIIIDDFSNDKTTEIAKKNLAKIIQRKLNSNFSDQRNYAFEIAKGDWIFFLDADEEITPELKQEIELFIKNNSKYSVAYIKRRDFWWGRELRYGEVRKVYKQGLIRLIKKNSGRWEGLVHEKFIYTGFSNRFKNYINHFPHPTIKDFINDINFYSTLRSEELNKIGRKTNIFDVSFTPLFKFIHNYLVKLGFLDGVQ